MRLPAAAMVLTLAGGVVAAFSGPAHARDVEDMQVSDEQPVVEKTYEPIPGQNAALLHRPQDCRTAAYCDVIDIEINRPDDLDESALVTVVITLTWEDLSDDADLDLYLYNPEGRPHNDSASGDPGEQAAFEDPSEDTWFIVVNNFAGIHQSYTVKAELQAEERQAIPDLVLPTPPPEPESTPTPPPARPIGNTAGTSSDEPDDDPEPTPKPVFTPGPDGAPREVALSSVPGSGTPIDQGGGWGWVLPVGVLGGLGGLATAAYLLRRQRQRRAE